MFTFLTKAVATPCETTLCPPRHLLSKADDGGGGAAAAALVGGTPQGIGEGQRLDRSVKGFSSPAKAAELEEEEEESESESESEPEEDSESEDECWSLLNLSVSAARAASIILSSSSFFFFSTTSRWRTAAFFFFFLDLLMGLVTGNAMESDESESSALWPLVKIKRQEENKTQFIC
jgi:hypothetical protein